LRGSHERAIVAAVVLALCGAGIAAAHGPEPAADRELVRLQGYRETRPAAAEIIGEVVLGILGKDHRFHLTARRTFHFAAAQAGTENRDRWVLQGDRAVLAAVASARPDQLVTILAEHRPGSGDLFLLTVDLCPEK
jgi:hypothetical protein